MADSRDQDVPAFAAMGRECPGANPNCQECCNIATNDTLRGYFGITKPADQIICECLDLCVQNVRLVCVHDINFRIPTPGVDQVFGCRLNVPIPGDLDPTFCRIIITCAEEELLGCNTPSPFVHVVVRGQVILKFVTAGPPPVTHFVAIPVTLLDANCNAFRRFPDGAVINNTPFPPPNQQSSPLKFALRKIDGSCITVNVACHFEGPNNECIRIQGKIIDKLWKEENVYVTGLRPYDLDVPEENTTITIKSEFANQAIPTCEDPTCNI